MNTSSPASRIDVLGPLGVAGVFQPGVGDQQDARAADRSRASFAEPRQRARAPKIDPAERLKVERRQTGRCVVRLTALESGA